MDIQFYDLTENTDVEEYGGTTGYKEWKWNVKHAREVLKRVPQQWIKFLDDGELPHRGNDNLPRMILTKEKEGHSFSIPYGNDPLVKGHTHGINTLEEMSRWLQHFCNIVDDGMYDDQLFAHHHWKLSQTKEA